MISLLLVLSPSHAGLPDGLLFSRHRQTWTGTEWTHIHDVDCDEASPYFLTGSPWSNTVSFNGLEGSGRDQAYLEYTVCDGFPSYLTSGVHDAFAAYGAAGVYFQEAGAPFVCAPLMPTKSRWDHDLKPSNAGWFADKLPSGEVELDTVHGIRYAPSSTHHDYYYVGVYGGGALKAGGFVYNTVKEMLYPPGGFTPTGPDSTWEMFINGVDILWSEEAPTAVAWQSPTFERHIADVVMHESAHVLGIGHPSSGEKVSFPSVTHAHSIQQFPNYKNNGLEEGATLYNTFSGPTAGTYRLPQIDHDFISAKYGYQPAFDYPSVRVHAWEGVLIGFSSFIIDVGWEGTNTSSPYYDFPMFNAYQHFTDSRCEPGDQPVNQDVLDALELALPRFSSGSASTIEVTFGAISSNPYNNVTTILHIDGSTFISVPSNGNYSLVPNLGSLDVTYSFTDNTASLVYEPMQVYAILNDAATGAALSPGVVFLNVQLHAASCLLEE